MASTRTMVINTISQLAERHNFRIRTLIETILAHLERYRCVEYRIFLHSKVCTKKSVVCFMPQNGSARFKATFWTQIFKFGPVVEMALQVDSSNFSTHKVPI
jgi:hypothetical protein